MRIVWLASMLLLGASAQAQTVYKCSVGGAVSYQSAPCAQGSVSRRWDYVPEPPSSPEVQARLDAMGRELILRNRPVVSRAGTARRAVVTVARPTACERARERQRASLERLKLKRTHDQLRRLDDQVTRHCR